MHRRVRNQATIGLSVLCEDPNRKTGLTTLFDALVRHGLRLYPEISWVIFASNNYRWTIRDERIQLVDHYPAATSTLKRLWSDHFSVPRLARKLGVDVLVTVGFVPINKCLPVAAHLLTFTISRL